MCHESTSMKRTNSALTTRDVKYRVIGNNYICMYIYIYIYISLSIYINMSKLLLLVWWTKPNRNRTDDTYNKIRNNYGWSRKGGSLRTTLSILEKEVRPKRRFGSPNWHFVVYTPDFDFFEMAHTRFFSSIRKNSISALDLKLKPQTKL